MRCEDNAEFRTVVQTVVNKALYPSQYAQLCRLHTFTNMVDIESQSLSVNGVLSRILTRSNQYINSRPQPTCSPSIPAGRIHIDLPEPPALLPALVAAGAMPEVAQAMQAAYHQRACEFREQALTTISRACSKLAQIPSTCSHTSDETIIAAFQQVYLKKLNTWISEGVALLQEKGPSVLRCREDNEGVPAKISKSFNHASTDQLCVDILTDLL